MAGWREELRQARLDVRLSRDALAKRCGLSPESLRAYETGRRHPPRPTLTAILDALEPDPVRRRSVMIGAGYAPDVDHVGQLAPAGDFTLPEALTEVCSWPWPGHVCSEFWEVLGANRLMQKVWDVDLEEERRDSVGMNLLACLSDRRFADRVGNWDAVITLIVAAVKGGYEDLFATDGAHPYLSAVVERFLAGHAPYVERFARIWSDTQPLVQRPRFSFPVVWRMPTGPDLRFRVSVNQASASEYMSFGEWIPVDGETWDALSRL